MMAASSSLSEARTFDEVVFGEGDNKISYSFEQFRAMPLRHRVKLLLGQVPRFYLNNIEIPRTQAMRLH